jgi:hypothetical protein
MSSTIKSIPQSNHFWLYADILVNLLGMQEIHGIFGRQGLSFEVAGVLFLNPYYHGG